MYAQYVDTFRHLTSTARYDTVLAHS